jgi:hypothetical protein
MKARFHIFTYAFCAGLVFGTSIHSPLLVAKLLFCLALLLGCIGLAVMMDRQ